jgi:hypothetical protein
MRQNEGHEMFANGGGKLLVIFLGALALAFGVTIPKLHKMAQIKGWVPGAVIRQKIVTQKGADPPRRARDFEKSYWVSWIEGDVGDSWKHRVRVPEDVWQVIKLGDQIEVIEVPGEENPHLRNDIFVEPGQFNFDYVLLAGELITAGAVFVLLILRYRRLRTFGGSGDASADDRPTPELTAARLREMLIMAIQKVDESLSKSRLELEQIEIQTQTAQTDESKNHFKQLADEKRRFIDELVKHKGEFEERLETIKNL